MSSKTRTVAYILLVSLFLSETGNHSKSNSSSPLFKFLLAFQLLQALGHPVLGQSPVPGVPVLPPVLVRRVPLLQKGDHHHSTPQQPLFVLPALCSKAGSHLFKGETLVPLGTLKSPFISLFAIFYLFFASDQVYFVFVVCLFFFYF